MVQWRGIHTAVSMASTDSLQTLYTKTYTCWLKYSATMNPMMGVCRLWTYSMWVTILKEKSQNANISIFRVYYEGHFLSS